MVIFERLIHSLSPSFHSSFIPSIVSSSIYLIFLTVFMQSHLFTNSLAQGGLEHSPNPKPTGPGPSVYIVGIIPTPRSSKDKHLPDVGQYLPLWRTIWRRIQKHSFILCQHCIVAASLTGLLFFTNVNNSRDNTVLCCLQYKTKVARMNTR